MRGAGAGLAARLDLGALGEVAAEAVDLLVVDRDRLVGAEGADLPAPAIAVVVVALLRAGGHWRCLLDGGGSPAGAAVRPRKGRQNGRSSRSSSRGGAAGRVGLTARAAATGAAGEAARRGGERATLLVADAGVEADDVVGGDLQGGPLLAVLGLVLAGAEAALDEDLVALAELLRGPLGAIAPDGDAVPVGPVVRPTRRSAGRGSRWLTATLNSVTGRPLGVYRISGSRPRLPMIMTFANAIAGSSRSVDGRGSGLALGLVDLLDDHVVQLLVLGGREVDVRRPRRRRRRPRRGGP